MIMGGRRGCNYRYSRLMGRAIGDEAFLGLAAGFRPWAESRMDLRFRGRVSALRGFFSPLKIQYLCPPLSRGSTSRTGVLGRCSASIHNDQRAGRGETQWMATRLANLQFDWGDTNQVKIF